MKATITIYKRNKENPMAIFVTAIQKSKSIDEAMANIRLIQEVPKRISDMFAKKYNPKYKLTTEQSFTIFYNEVKANSFSV